MKQVSLGRLAPWAMAGALLADGPPSVAGSSLPSGALSVRLVELHGDAGRVGCGVWSSKKGFPKDRRVALRTEWCSIANREALCSFPPIPAGTYAVACFHDENSNGVLDKSFLGIPTEGMVASNHAKGFLGPPSFEAARFVFSGSATELRLKMGY